MREHMDFFLGQVLEDVYTPLTLGQIKERLREATDINLSEATIKKDLRKFSEKYGENLLCPVGDCFRLNRCLYGAIKMKPPKGYLPEY